MPAQTEPLGKLADDFWKWRAQNAPFTGDDVNRMERPDGVRDWSRTSIEKIRGDLAKFETRWKSIDGKSGPIVQQVDYRLIGSALARVHWEVDVNPRWKRDPNFYFDQTLTALAEALTVPAPYNEAQSREILTRIQNIPAILKQAETNLDKPPAPFASVAIQSLDGVRERLRKTAEALLPNTTIKEQDLKPATERAGEALEQFRTYLEKLLPSPADGVRPRALHLLPQERRPLSLLTRGHPGDGPAGMESRSCLRNLREEPQQECSADKDGSNDR